MDYAALKAELQSNNVAEYAAALAVRDDTTLANLLNAPRQPAQRTKYISARTLLGIGPVGVSILEKFKGMASDANPDAGSRATAQWTLEFLRLEAGIDIGNPVALATVEALQTQGVFTQQERDLLFSLCTVQISRAEFLFGRPVSVAEVSTALNPQA